MRIRRILATVIATGALAGSGLAGATTVTAAENAPSYVTPDECEKGGGRAAIDEPGNLCIGGKHHGEKVD
ncbi:hypothetical protein [Streptomyces thermoalcalitolerans]|uniref:Chaplin domain-containing protein n=1 Tax=Streptomyces thermoalcalitolerans TaxID=65605 RepID=A0ABN1P613_9ACTN